MPHQPLQDRGGNPPCPLGTEPTAVGMAARKYGDRGCLCRLLVPLRPGPHLDAGRLADPSRRSALPGVRHIGNPPGSVNRKTCPSARPRGPPTAKPQSPGPLGRFPALPLFWPSARMMKTGRFSPRWTQNTPSASQVRARASDRRRPDSHSPVTYRSHWAASVRAGFGDRQQNPLVFLGGDRPRPGLTLALGPLRHFDCRGLAHQPQLDRPSRRRLDMA